MVGGITHVLVCFFRAHGSATGWWWRGALWGHYSTGMCLDVWVFAWWQVDNPVSSYVWSTRGEDNVADWVPTTLPHTMRGYHNNPSIPAEKGIRHTPMHTSKGGYRKCLAHPPRALSMCAFRKGIKDWQAWLFVDTDAILAMVHLDTGSLYLAVTRGILPQLTAHKVSLGTRPLHHR